MKTFKISTNCHCEPRKGRSNLRLKIASSHLVVLLAMTVLLVSFIFSGCGRFPQSAPSQKTVYQCSMHPKIISDKPENCPICGMRLTRVEHPEAGDAVKSGGKGRILFYRHPMRPEVSSPVPAKDEMGMDYIPVYEEEESGVSSVSGRAVVNIDPARQQQIGVKIAEVKKMPLQMNVRALGRVAYDPDLHNTIGEYREAAGEYLKSKSSPNITVRERAEQLMELADLKLRLSGISSDQMEHLKGAGQSTLRLLTLRHTAEDLSLPEGAKWVYADLYENESDLAAPGQKIRVTTPALPGRIFEGQTRTADLIPNALIRTMRVRMEVMDPEDRLRAGMSVDVALQILLGEKLAIPEEAVLNTGEKNLVFVAKGKGRFEPREVRIGYEAGGYDEVISGLSENEKVASSANFLIDSESRIRAALQNFGKPEILRPDGTQDDKRLRTQDDNGGAHAHD